MNKNIERFDSGDFILEFTKNEKGELDGESTTFDKRSQKIIEKISYKNNKINGLYISYFYSENKSGRTEVPYIDDKKEGTALSYINDVIFMEEPFVNNKRNGVAKIYKVIEGKQILWCETSFKDDVKDGISIEYEDDGKTIKQKTMWKNGEKIEINT